MIDLHQKKYDEPPMMRTQVLVFPKLDHRTPKGCPLWAWTTQRSKRSDSKESSPQMTTEGESACTWTKFLTFYFKMQLCSTCKDWLVENVLQWASVKQNCSIICDPPQENICLGGCTGTCIMTWHALRTAHLGLQLEFYLNNKMF